MSVSKTPRADDAAMAGDDALARAMQEDHIIAPARRCSEASRRYHADDEVDWSKEYLRESWIDWRAAAIGVTNRTLAEVDRPLRSTASPVGWLAAFCCAATIERAPDPPSPAGAALEARLTGLPSIVMREMTMPSVTSAGTHGAACGALPRK